MAARMLRLRRQGLIAALRQKRTAMMLHTYSTKPRCMADATIYPRIRKQMMLRAMTSWLYSHTISRAPCPAAMQGVLSGMTTL